MAADFVHRAALLDAVAGLIGNGEVESVGYELKVSVAEANVLGNTIPTDAKHDAIDTEGAAFVGQRDVAHLITARRGRFCQKRSALERGGARFGFSGSCANPDKCWCG